VTEETLTQGSDTPRISGFGLCVAILGIGLLLAAVLAFPGRTVTTKYVNDLFIFLDGAQRIWSGQAPNVDFHTSLGPLAFYLPAAGYGLTGNMGAAMPVGMALVVILLALVAAPVIASRMRWTIGLPLAVFLLLIAAVPANPGEWIGEMSFAMFYNRMGWAALGLMFVVYLPRTRQTRRGEVVDAACAAILVVLMLYTKITYALVELAFLAFLLTDRTQRRWVALSMALVAVCVAGIELVWHGSLQHIADLRLAGEVSGGFPSAEVLVNVALKNLADLAIFSLFGVLLVVVTRDWRDLLFAGFCGATGLLIIEQNFQIVGILTLGAAAAVMSEVMMRQRQGVPSSRPLGLPLLLLVLILPPSASHAITLGMHAVMATSDKGEPIALPRFGDIRLVSVWSDAQYGFFQRYNQTLADGRSLVTRVGAEGGHTAVLDFVNPFTAGMGLQPPRGDSAWYHWGRTLNSVHFPPPEVIFADVVVILDPKAPIEPWTTGGMRDIYRAFIDSHYQLVEESPDWRIYRRLP
jgi:hypothetical protein